MLKCLIHNFKKSPSRAADGYRVKFVSKITSRIQIYSLAEELHFLCNYYNRHEDDNDEEMKADNWKEASGKSWSRPIAQTEQPSGNTDVNAHFVAHQQEKASCIGDFQTSVTPSPPDRRAQKQSPQLRWNAILLSSVRHLFVQWESSVS